MRWIVIVLLCLCAAARADDTSPSLRGARRQKRAGIGLMVIGAVVMTALPIVIGVLDRACENHPDSSDCDTAGVFGLTVALPAGMVGGELLTMGGVLYKTAHTDEVRLSAGPGGVAVTF